MHYSSNVALIPSILFVLMFFVIGPLESREISIRVNIPGAQIFQWNYIHRPNQVQRVHPSSTSIPVTLIPNDETKIHTSNKIMTASLHQSHTTGAPVTEKITSEPDTGLESASEEDEFLQWLKDNPSPMEKPIEEILDISHHFQNPVVRLLESK